jgi:vanillate O-demethylase monooxygenase subunit
VTPIARGVRFERWLSAEPGPRTQATAPMDRWQSYDFLVPGILLMVGGNYPVGTAEKCRGGPPDLADAVSGVTFTGQAVTPTGPKTSRYFFSWGPRRDHGDEAHRDTLMGIAARAFAEDKAMIEAQQLVLDASPGARVMPTAADKGLTLFHNLTEKLRREEASVNVA